MRIKLLAWTCSKNASDGSYIPENVWSEYLRSDRAKTAIEDGTMLCTLTHRSRSLAALPEGFGGLRGVTGKDDGQLIVSDDMPAPVMKIVDLYLEGDKVFAEAEVFDESLFDHAMSEQIKRFKGLLRSGVKLGCSCVLVCYWESDGAGHDIGKRIQNCKAIDLTVNPSCPDSKVLGILEDEAPLESTFSEKESKTLQSGGVLCKTFSDPSSIPGVSELPKSSKIGLRVCPLKVKQFSQISEVMVLGEKAKATSAQQKEFSVASVKERLRFAKLSPRMQFRRLLLDYKGAVKAAGGTEKMKPEEVRLLKSMFVNDILLIIKQIHEDVLKGKMIATLIGASSISKNCREAAQRLQLPYKMAMQMQAKQGYISKDRMDKIQTAYIDFTNSIVDEVFSAGFNIKETPEDTTGEEEEV